jgi:hypothetical protein
MLREWQWRVPFPQRLHSFYDREMGATCLLLLSGTKYWDGQ